MASRTSKTFPTMMHSLLLNSDGVEEIVSIGMWREPSAHRKSCELRNQGSASCEALRLSRARESGDAKLLHHAKSVPTDVGIHNFSIDDVMDRDSVHGNFLVCGGNSHVFAFVSAGNSPGNGQLFFFSNDVLDGETQIGETSYEPRDLALVGFRTNRRTGEGGIVESVTGGDDFVK